MRWDPLRELLVLNELRHDSCRSGASTWIPAVDLYETFDRYVAIIELPGLGQSDFDLSVAADTLTLRGQRPAPEVPAAQYVRIERTHGRFERRFTFPDRIDADGIEATFRDGVLTVVVRKAERAGATRVVVSSGLIESL